MTAHSHSAAQGPAQESAKPSLLGRLRQLPSSLVRLLAAARHNPLKVGVPLLLGVVAMIGLGVVGSLAILGGKSGGVTVAEILQPLDDGEWQQARARALRLRADPELPDELLSACQFVLGMVVAEDAEQAIDPAQQRLLYLIAARYLEQSAETGFPARREAAGLLALARCQQRANRFADAVATYTEALPKNPDSAIEIEQALTDCLLKVQPPQIAAALQHNAQLLALPGLSPRQRDEAHLLAANIHFTANNGAACEQALANVREGSSLFPQAQALAARVVLRGLAPREQTEPLADDARQSLAALLTQLQPLAEQKGLEPLVASQLDLLVAMCHARLGDQQQAAQGYAQLRKVHHGSPAALAATFWEAEWLASTGNVEESLALFSAGLTQAGPAEQFANPWLSREELQQLLDAALRRYQELKDFAQALELAKRTATVISPAQALLWQAEVERSWAEDLLAQRPGKTRDERHVLEANARAHLRAAARHDRDLAQERIATRAYPTDLLRSAQTYLQGHGFEQAELMFRQFLQQQTREGQPQALVGLGQAQLALNRPSEALQTLAQVGSLYEKHPASYQARVLSAAALREQGKLAAARELLDANLFDSALTPQSTEWRDSLFALGSVQFRQGLVHQARSQNVPPRESLEKTRAESLQEAETAAGYFAEAIKTLAEATQRFPAAPQYVIAHYEAAEAYRHSAKWPRLRLESVTIDSSRQALHRQLQSDLTAAVAEYTRLIENLADEQESNRELVDLKILRNCYFNRADALFDLGQYQEAIQAYSAATNRYQHEPEALEAYIQIANCYRRQQRYAEARGTLEQARVVLQRIRKDADFAKTTRFDRKQWIELLDWYSTL